MFGGSFVESHLMEIRVSDVPSRAFRLVVDWSHATFSDTQAAGVYVVGDEQARNAQTANGDDCIFNNLKVDQCTSGLINVLCDSFIKKATLDDTFIEFVFEALLVAEMYLLDDFRNALLSYIAINLDFHMDNTNVCDIFAYSIRLAEAKSMARRCAAYVITNRSAHGVELFQSLVRDQKSEFTDVVLDILFSALQ